MSSSEANEEKKVSAEVGPVKIPVKELLIGGKEGKTSSTSRGWNNLQSASWTNKATHRDYLVICNDTVDTEVCDVTVGVHSKKEPGQRFPLVATFPKQPGYACHGAAVSTRSIQQSDPENNPVFLATGDKSDGDVAIWKQSAPKRKEDDDFSEWEKYRTIDPPDGGTILSIGFDQVRGTNEKRELVVGSMSKKVYYYSNVLDLEEEKPAQTFDSQTYPYACTFLVTSPNVACVAAGSHGSHCAVMLFNTRDGSLLQQFKTKNNCWSVVNPHSSVNPRFALAAACLDTPQLRIYVEDEERKALRKSEDEFVPLVEKFLMDYSNAPSEKYTSDSTYGCASDPSDQFLLACGSNRVDICDINLNHLYSITLGSGAGTCYCACFLSDSSLLLNIGGAHWHLHPLVDRWACRRPVALVREKGNSKISVLLREIYYVWQLTSIYMPNVVSSFTRRQQQQATTTELTVSSSSASATASSSLPSSSPPSLPSLSSPSSSSSSNKPAIPEAMKKQQAALSSLTETPVTENNECLHCGVSLRDSSSVPEKCIASGLKHPAVEKD